MTTYIATIRHHSIARAREIAVNGTLAQAKAAATKEFGGEQRDCSIAIYADDHPAGPFIVSERRVAARKWQDRI